MPDDGASKFTVSLSDGRATLIGDHGQQTNIFQIFADALPAIASQIRGREFRTLIDERTRGFVGREFVFRAVEDLLHRVDFLSGYIVIRGEPGIGKTALLGELVKRRQDVHHFNVAAQNIRSARDFLSNVCAQLIVRYRLPHAQMPPDASRDSGYLSTLLAEAAGSSGGEPIVIVVDALDEADDTGLAPSVNRLYLPAVLPQGTFFVVTTREQVDYRLTVDRREDIYLRDNDPQNIDDIRQFSRTFIETHRETMAPRIDAWGVDEDEFVGVMSERSQGNFMYLVYVLRDIREGRLTRANIDNIRKLPQGLRDYYRRHWRQMEDADAAVFASLYKPVICLLAAVREPVSISQIEDWTRLDGADIRNVLATWRPFLNMLEDVSGEERFRLYHVSFQDFLREDVGLTQQHEAIALRALSKIPGMGA